MAIAGGMAEGKLARDAEAVEMFTQTGMMQ
jgi:hypothetical protein